MKFISDQWQKPALRYGLLAVCAALPLFGSLTSLSLAAVLGASCGVGLLTTLIIEVGLYFKSIGDETKLTITELRETIKNVKKSTKTIEDEKTIAHLSATITELGNTAKVLQQNLAIDPKKGQKPLAQTLNEVLEELKGTAENLKKNLAFDPKKGEKPLVKQVGQTLTELNKTVNNVNKNIMFDTKKGEKPIGKEVSETLDELTKTLNKLGKNLETNPKDGQQPLAQQLTEAVEKINSSVEKINSGMDVAGTVFYPLTSALNGVKKLGRKIGVLEAEKSVAVPLLTHHSKKPVSPARSAQDRRVGAHTRPVVNPENQSQDDHPRTRARRKAGLR